MDLGHLVTRLLGVDAFFARWQEIVDDPVLLCGCDEGDHCEPEVVEAA